MKFASKAIRSCNQAIAISTGEANRLWGVVSMVASLERHRQDKSIMDIL